MTSDNRRLQPVSEAIEALLVRRNPRGMATVRDALAPGYLLRAGTQLLRCTGPIAIVTGFPVRGALETDGPAAARVLYDTLQRLGRSPYIWIETRDWAQFFPDCAHQPLEVTAADPSVSPPGAVIVIERPGAAADGHFYNIRGIDISDQCRAVEDLLTACRCPIVAIGDGGNEVGMGKAGTALTSLPIVPAVSGCDELIAADVSNWGGYALAMMLQVLAGQRPQLPNIPTLLQRLIEQGAVDGVSGAPTATEDGFDADIGHSLLTEIAGILAPSDAASGSGAA
jgi:hypothetical protein